MIQEALNEVLNKKDLSYEMAHAVMAEIMDGTATNAQMGAFLAALRMKGETVTEITACAEVMREKGLKVEVPFDVMEIVGTGGDEVGTFNISTTSAFVVAAGGVPVAKHGNRSVSSKSGAADVLERLGARLDLTPEQNVEVLKKANMCFMFAQVYHTSMKNVGPVRKEMGARTIFNILGPLTNPARANMQLMGVYREDLVEPMAQVLSNLGVVRGLVVNGSDGLDEATMTGATHMCEIREGKFRTYDLTPEALGMRRCTLQDLVGGTPEENARISRDILTGKLKGPKRDAVILNSALSLYLGIDDCSIPECVKMANEIIDSGKAGDKLEQFVAATKEV
ncbi:anthranilate phosphoribosyltransferase [Oscillospiraceae bacterium Marseille-Q3528]|nr:anthranilate phosphoribosyltransferase [Oscillospiraceae bacterium Marseille-Q3528]